MKSFRKPLCFIFALCLLLSFAGCSARTADISGLFRDEQKMSYSKTYTELSANKKNKTNSWREGMISGNGLQGVIVSGSPYSDTLIFQNMHFIMPNGNIRYCPDTADELETVKQNIVAGENIVDNASYDDVYRFHPGGELRIDQEKNTLRDYVRYTDYETAETGVRYTDGNGTWRRTTFTSQADGVTITKLSQSDSEKKLNVTLSFDDISVLANYGDGDEQNIQYKKLAADDGSYLALVAHYPDYENSELKNGGYATVTYVLNDGGKTEKVSGREVTDAQYASDENPQLHITDADNLYLITVSDRTYDMGSFASFAGQTDYPLISSIVAEEKAVAEKYTVNGTFDYDAALNEHLKLWQPQFDAVTLTLSGGDSTQSNEELTASQRRKKTIHADLAQRAYYAGRYAYLCASGYSTPRLYGMWTGEWNTGWGSKYTMDANVNLQTSSMNTGNMSSSYIGYAQFILRQVADWEENALATHGFTDAIQAPVNTDGDKAVLTETCYPYPFRYWNAGTSWMLQPLYETLLCYGDVSISLTEEFNLETLRSVLSLTEEDLTDEEMQAIRDRGSLDLKSEILLPLLTKAANYWEQLMTPEYYTDASGGIHYEKGKTTLADGEYYCILPGYSPENNPANYPSPSVANTAIDIAACRDTMKMLIDIAKQVNPDADTAKWEQFTLKIPPYLYDETGALKEFCCTQFEENNEHRHLSHLYCVWPLFETQKDDGLKQAAEQAIANRESENEASHALVHRSLIAARLKDSDSLTAALLSLLNHKIQYNSLMTNHDYDRGSCYCTDFAIGYLGIVNEALVFSDKNEIEILPALPTSGFDAGTVTGLRCRTQAQIDSLTWSLEEKTAVVTITSDIDQTINVSCGKSDETKQVTLKAGETKELEFVLS